MVLFIENESAADNHRSLATASEHDAAVPGLGEGRAGGRFQLPRIGRPQDMRIGARRDDQVTGFQLVRRPLGERDLTVSLGDNVDAAETSLAERNRPGSRKLK